MTAMLTTLTAPLAALGAACLNTLREFGRVAIFFVRGVLGIFSLPLQIAKFVSQVSIIGARSVLVICLTGAFTGMVLGLQGYYTLVKFGAQGMLGAAVALSLIREMGPVLTRGFSLDGLVDAEASTYISIREPRIPPVSPQPAARPYNPDRGSSIIDTTIAVGRRSIFPFGIVWLAAALLAGAVAARAQGPPRRTG